MYEDFERYISSFSLEREPGDYWYDCAILDATEILMRFDDGDWEALLRGLDSKSIFWKRRLVQCLGGLHVQNEIEVILRVIDTQDEDLLVDCIDSLRSLGLSRLGRLEREKIMLGARLISINYSSPVKEVLEDFFENFGSES